MGASTVLLCGVVLIHVFASQTDAQRPRSPWKTLSGDAPRVISRGGFSGLFPDSSLDAYNFALQTSVADAILWCDVQLTKDGAGICFPDLNMSNASTIEVVYPKGQKTYPVNGVPTQGWFTVDFSLKDLNKVYLIRGILSRSDRFDGNGYTISTVQTVNIELRPRGLWLNVQHDAFYAQNNLSMSNFLISASKNVSIDYISSPEVNFFTKIAGRFGHNGPIFVFRFLEKETFERTTNRSYGSILSNLTFVKTFASGILVPKSYVLPLDDKQYLLPSTSLVQDAHKAGLEVFVSGFANDVDIAHDYSYDPVSEYLSFVDNGNFSVDGVLSDFPISASASVECFSHLRRNATKQGIDFLVISKNGASGDYPGCTDLAYDKAIRDGAGVIDCSVQMSRDGKPFCSHSIDLSNITNIAQTSFAQRSTHVPEISSNDGIYTFSLTWSEIQSLIPAISNPYRNAMYLRQKQGLNMVKAVLDTLTETAYSTRITTTKVMIQSTDSSVLVEFRNQSKYETVYKVEKTISDISDSAIEEIKEFASAVVITKVSVFPTFYGFVTGQTNVVERLQKSQLPVYVELFQNEFVSQPYDFFSDATVEINSYVTGAGVNGTITEFPFTAARYRRNKCLGSKETLPYMAPVQPGGLLEVVSPASLPPAEAPNPVFTDADVPGYDHYKQCSQTFLCGNQGGLLYPFWTPDRETCGYPGFKLNCSQGFAELTVSSVKFRILNANYTSRNIRLARSDYIDNICPSDPLNGPFYQNALQLANDTNLLTMLYDCQDLSSIIYSSEAYNYVTDFQCKEGVKNNNYCVVINSSSSLFNGRDGIDYMKENCTDYVSMPFSGSNLHTLDSNNLKKTLEQGFELQLKQDCSMCLESKGACGYDQAFNRFVCYCDDGTHGDTCSSGKTSQGSLVNAIGKVSGSVAGVVMFLVLLSLFLCYLWKRETRQRQQNLKSLIPLKHYSYAQVKRITKSFAEVVGRGGFGIVYRGTLPDGRMVAVKVLKDSKGNGKSRRLIEDEISNEEHELAKKMALVGLWCIQSSPLDRPPMNRVVEMMEGSLDALEVPPRPVLQIPIAPLQEPSTLSRDISVYTEE
ncbi:hypothetical protein HID58_012755 [Brassica napus]|uniref:Glycerophosphodiester phosphodiesterase n=1 Tax=Brassica napus TaxID=3708 RepID=A0ABQ8E1Z2_BRANA|nr:hypothetical protein HID58_012755 [Brassica napus]